MNSLKFVKPEPLLLAAHTEFSEKWVQARIAEDPTLLGLGDLVLRDQERTQPRAGRLDLLLQDPESLRRYEVELQLGPTDESHIIRTIEYWDIERKRYPQYEHCAVIVAEEITARFLNVISLFNGTVPLIAVQMNAFRIGDSITLVFITVLDELSRGLVDDDEEVSRTTDRAYWEERGSKTTMAMADEMLRLIRTVAPGVEFNYKQGYIGFTQNGETNNFALLRPKKQYLRLELRVKESPDITTELEQAGIDLMEYDRRFRYYRIRLNAEADIMHHRELLLRLLRAAYGVNP